MDASQRAASRKIAQIYATKITLRIQSHTSNDRRLAPLAAYGPLRFPSTLATTNCGRHRRCCCLSVRAGPSAPGWARSFLERRISFGFYNSSISSAATQWRGLSQDSGPNQAPSSIDGTEQPTTATKNNGNGSESQTTSANAATTSDPPILTWVDEYLPSKWQPYARLARIDKPIGTWLLLWPCLWSTAMAAPAGHLPDPYLLSLFSIGALVMRGSGCTINDMWDADIDRQVQRTASRPLARGDVTHRQALGFLAAQLSVGLGVLVSLPHTFYCFAWGVSSLPLVVSYPLMKRYTDWPQLVLGMTFNWGAWMGWAATYGSMDYSIIAPLYASGVTWTLVYDTIYANQDKEDDAKLGLHSTALTFGEDVPRHKLILNTFATATWVFWLMAGYAASDDMVSFPAYSAGVTAAYGHLLWQVRTADLNNPHNLAERFRSNTTVGGIIFVSVVAGKMVGAV